MPRGRPPSNKRKQKESESKTIIKPKAVKSPVLEYTRNVGRGGRTYKLISEQPEWDLAEAGRLIDTEAIFRQVCDKKKNLFLKEGYDFVGDSPERIKYIEKRLQQMEEATGKAFPVLLSQTVSSLVRLGNAFWAKARDIKASGGKVRRNADDKELNPVAGYFILPAETIRFYRDGFGKIIKYQQYISGKEPIVFAPEDIIHFYWDKREGFSVGTPIMVPVLDDIRALRRIEETVELLVDKHLFPLFHYKVGTPEQPARIYPDGTSEVDAVRDSIMEIPSDGCWVTPERHAITAIGAEGKALAVEHIIEHFKNRILVGLGVSPVDMGIPAGASRSAAQTVSRNLIDNTKAYQKEFGSQFYAHVIKELLLESTYDEKTLFDKKNQVFLKFTEIDFEARMARGNHYVDLWNKNAITHSEMRKAIGYEPFIEKDWKETYWGRIEKERVILQALDEPGTPESKAVAAASTQKVAGGGTAEKPQALPTRKSNLKKEGGVATKNKPKNQHGTRPAAKLNKDYDRLYHISPLKVYDDFGKDLIGIIKQRGWNFETAIQYSSIAIESSLAKLNSIMLRLSNSHKDGKVFDILLNSIYSDLVNHIDKSVTGITELKNEDSLLIDLLLANYRRKIVSIIENDIFNDMFKEVVLQQPLQDDTIILLNDVENLMEE